MNDVIIHESYQKFLADHIVCKSEVYEKLESELDEHDLMLIKAGGKALLLHLRIDDKLFGDIYFNGESNCSCCDHKSKFDVSIQLVIEDDGFPKLWMIVVLTTNNKDYRLAFPITKENIVSLGQSSLILMPKSEPMMKSMECHSHVYGLKYDVNVLKQMTKCIDYVANTKGITNKSKGNA